MKMDMNALNRMSKDMETKERMRKKMEAKKQTDVKYSLDKKENSDGLVFRLDGEEKQDKSFIHPDILKEIEHLENTIIPSTAPSNTAPKKKKKNKGKK